MDMYNFIINQGVTKAEEIPVSALVLQEALHDYYRH